MNMREDSVFNNVDQGLNSYQIDQNIQKVRKSINLKAETNESSDNKSGQKFYNRQETLESDRRQSIVSFIHHNFDQENDIAQVSMVQKLMKENSELRQKLSCKEYEIITIQNQATKNIE